MGRLQAFTWVVVIGCGGGGLDSPPLDAGEGDGGGGLDAGVSGDGGCPAITCADVGANCGELADGCGGTLSCGECPAPAACGARGQANLCAIPEGDRECTTGGWCFENPAPQPMRPLAMFATAPDDVWAVGEHNAISHFDGGRWVAMTGGGGEHLRGVWAAGGQEAWAVGDDGALLRWDGVTWSPVAAGQGSARLGGVFGTGPEDVWVVGHGVARHYNGARWLPAGVVTPDLDHVFAAGERVWATGEGRVWEWTGSSWSAQTPEAPVLSVYRLYGIHGRSAQDVWAVGHAQALFDGDELVYRFDGASWENVHLNGSPSFFDVFGTPTRTVAGGADGITLLSGGPPVPALEERAAQGAAAGNFQAVMTFSGEPLRLTGDAWIRDSFGLRSGMVALGSAGERVWVGGEGALLEWTGGGFREHRPGDRSYHQFWSVWGAGENDVWAIEGDFGLEEPRRAEAIWRWDGAAWTEHELPQNGFSPMLAIRPTSSGVFVAGEGAIYRRELQTWTSVHTSEATWRALDEDQDGIVWAAGGRPGEQETDGAAVIGRAQASGFGETVVPGTNVLCSLDVIAEDDIWAGGYRTVADGDDFGNDPDPRATISHFDGQTWLTVELPADAKLCAVMALGPGDVYATGDGAELFHFDGQSWASTRIVRAGSLHALLPTADALWAAGDYGGVLQREP